MKLVIAEIKFNTPDLDQIIEKMDRFIRSFAESGDPRERFLLMYRTFKNELRSSIRQGRFLDARWSEAICCRMAETYFEALEKFQRADGTCPDCWNRSFTLSLNHRTNLLQDALLGMNAHINYDLSIATFDTLQRFQDLEETAPARGIDRSLNRRLKQRYYDYLLINQIAWESIPLIQDVLASRFTALLGLLNRFSFRISKYFMEKIIMEYRDRSWGHVLLMATVSDPVEMVRLRQFMDIQAVKNIQRIMSGLSWNPLVFMKSALNGFPSGKVVIRPADDESIANLLIAKLEKPAIAAYARRALIEYGMEAECELISALQKTDLHSSQGKLLIDILFELGSPEAISTLFSLLPRSDSRTRDLICRELSVFVQKKRLPDTINDNVIPQIRQEVVECCRIKLQLGDLQSLPVAELLKETLRYRLRRGLQRINTLLAMLSADPAATLEELHFSGTDFSGPIRIAKAGLEKLSEIKENWPVAINPLFQDQPDTLSDIAGSQFGLSSKSWPEHLQQFMKSSDLWLQKCTVELILTQSLEKMMRAAEEAISQHPELVADLEGSEVRSESSINNFPNLKKLSERSKMLSTVEKVLHLKNSELFTEIPAEELTEVARLTTETRVGNGEYLIREGEAGKELVIILEGKIEVLKGGSRITELGPNAVIGEMSLLSDLPTTADCRAASPVKALTVSKENFRRLLYGDHPEIAVGLLRVLTERLERTTRELRECRQKMG